MKVKFPSGFLAAWIITTTVVVFCADAALASGPHHGKGHKMPTFAEVDADGDGFIVAEELYTMQARRMAARAEAGGKLKRAGERPTFEDIDLDGDGKVSEEEFAAHQAERHPQTR